MNLDKIKDSELTFKVKPCVCFVMLQINEHTKDEGMYCNNWYLSMKEALDLQARLTNVIKILEERSKSTDGAQSN